MSNFIKDIEISNFKSIRHQKIEGCKRINVFIGYPNVGKSNILEALAMLSYINAGEPKISQLTRVEDYTELFFDANIVNDIEINYSPTRKLKIKYNSDQQLTISHLILKGDEAENLDVYFKDVPTYVERKIDIIKNAEVRLEKNEHLALSIELEKYKPINVKNYNYKSGIPKGELGDRWLYFPEGQNLFHIVSINSELRKEVVALLSFYGLKLLFEKGNKYSMKAMKTLNDETIFSIPFHQIADTLQRLIFYKAAIQTNQNSVLIFEEPEAHMFPPYIRKFTSDVVFDKTNQFFIATHSPYVLDEFIEEAVDDLAIFLVDYKNGETIVKNLSKENVEEIREYGVDLFFNLESYLKNGQVNNA